MGSCKILDLVWNQNWNEGEANLFFVETMMSTCCSLSNEATLQIMNPSLDISKNISYVSAAADGNLCD